MKPKVNYIALARVSSREQEREGFSLDVQEDALRRYAMRNGGEIVKLYRIAETASKQAERKTFKEMLAYSKKNAHKLDGLLFYKVDRAARNLFDYVELERLEVDYNLPVVYVAQPTENTPAGRMQRRILANMASFYTEQQSLDVREGQARRVENGLFPCKAPYGYVNKRVDGRSLVEIDPDAAVNVRRIFELYSQHGQTLDGVVQAMMSEGRNYTVKQPNFVRSKIHNILRDRSYIGEILYRGQWLSGKHQPLVSHELFGRVQLLLGDKTYAAHDSVYGAGMVKCGHCGRPIVCEVKNKSTSKGPKEYRYYRCSRYTAKGHPRVRVSEKQLDKQMTELFQRMKVDDPKIHSWIVKIIQLKAETFQREDEKRLDDLQHQIVVANRQRNRLLNMRIAEEINRETFAAKDTELRQQISHLSVLVDSHSREKSEYADIAVKTFELSQQLENKWVTGDISAKRQILEILCLNYKLDDVSLAMTMRKPFDVLAKRPLVSLSRRDKI